MSTSSTTWSAAGARTCSGASRSGGSNLVDGRHPRPRPGPRPHQGRRPGLPPGRDPHHPVRRGAPAGPGGAGRRHLQRRSRRPPSTTSTRSSPPRRPRSTAWPSSSRPPSGTTTTTTTPSTVPRSRFNEGMLRSFRAMYGLDYVGAALLQRLRAADGRPRSLHRGAGALDGAHRRRPAAADLRRRVARRWTSSTPRTSPGRTSSPRRSDVTEGVYNIASGSRDQPASSWPRRCCG